MTDGPYLEAKEFVSSFFILDVESEERALEIAAEYPFAARNAVEVWPILHESGRRSDPAAATSRTCCASWRRRSSARWSAGTGASTCARTPCRRRC